MVVITKSSDEGVLASCGAVAIKSQLQGNPIILGAFLELETP